MNRLLSPKFNNKTAILYTEDVALDTRGAGTVPDMATYRVATEACKAESQLWQNLALCNSAPIRIETVAEGGYYGKRVPSKAIDNTRISASDICVKLDNHTIWAAAHCVPIIDLTVLARPAKPKSNRFVMYGGDGMTFAVQKIAHDYLADKDAGFSFELLSQPSISKWEEKLNKMGDLLPGWDSYHAAPPSSATLTSARQFLRFLLQNGKEPAKLTPSVVGGVCFTFRNKGRRVYIEFRNTGRAHAAFDGDDVRDPVVVRMQLNVADYTEIVGKVKSHLYEQTSSGNEAKWTSQ